MTFEGGERDGHGVDDEREIEGLTIGTEFTYKCAKCGEIAVYDVVLLERNATWPAGHAHLRHNVGASLAAV